jgi:hypothetical protein
MFVSTDMEHVHLAYFSSMLSTYVMYLYPSVMVNVLSQVSPNRSLFTSHLCTACVLSLSYSFSDTGSITPNKHDNV